MKGSNTMELNEETMIEAMQEWLERRWNFDTSDCPIVHKVGLKTSSPITAFEISLKEGEDPDDD